MSSTNIFTRKDLKKHSKPDLIKMIEKQAEMIDKVFDNAKLQTKLNTIIKEGNKIIEDQQSVLYWRDLLYNPCHEANKSLLNQAKS